MGAHTFGTALTDRDYRQLEGCGIQRSHLEQAGWRRVDDAEGRLLVGRGDCDRYKGSYAGLAIPNVLPGSQYRRAWRVRRDLPDVEQGADGTLKERAKYVASPGGGNNGYFPPGVDPNWFSDASLKVIITEGEKKSLALWALAWHGLSDADDRPRFLPVGISGAWNWRGTVGKREGPNGERQNVKGVIDDLEKFSWKNREAIILFDADVHWHDITSMA